MNGKNQLLNTESMVSKIRNFILFKKYPITKQMFKFGIVGICNVFLDILFYWFLTRILNLYYLLAATISFIILVTWSFYINRRWTYRHNGTDISNQYIKFVVTNLIAIFLNLGLMYIAVEHLYINDLIAKVVIGVSMGLFNFTVNKLWTFKQYEVKQENIINK